MILKKALLATTAVLISFQPVLSQAQSQPSGAPVFIELAQAADAAANLNDALAELKLARENLAAAKEADKGIKKARKALKAARTKVDQAKEILEAVKSAEPIVEPPKENAKKAAKKAARKAAKKAAKKKAKQAAEAGAVDASPKGNTETEQIAEPLDESVAPIKKPNADVVASEPVEEKTDSEQQLVGKSSEAELKKLRKKKVRVEDAEAAPEDQAPAQKKVKARKPKREAKPVEEQLQQAAEKPVSVLPEKVSKQEKAALAAAEKERRSEARKRRNELLGAAAVGVAVGVIAPILGGKLVEDQGDRVVIEREGEYFIRKDENALLRRNGVQVDHFELENGRSREVMTRPNGVKIITVRSANGDILKRERRLPNGEIVVLIDNMEHNRERRRNFVRELPPLNPTIDHGLYVVSATDVEEQQIVEAFAAPPVEVVREAYALREIRESERLRSIVRRLDLDTIRFDSGSSTVRQSQVERMGRIASAMAEVMNQNPSTVFLIEGHTDAVGGDIYNLALSDRRAETVARILIDSYGLPPENFVVEGYGEAYLKIDTQADEVRNRRVAIRNITPLLTANN